MHCYKLLAIVDMFVTKLTFVPINRLWFGQFCSNYFYSHRWKNYA